MGIETFILQVLETPGGVIGIATISVSVLTYGVFRVFAGTGNVVQASSNQLEVASEGNQGTFQVLERRITKLESGEAEAKAQIEKLQSDLKEVEAKLNQQIGINLQLEKSMNQIIGDKDHLLIQLGKAHQEVESLGVEKERLTRQIDELQRNLNDSQKALNERVTALEKEATQPITTVSEVVTSVGL